MCSCGGDGMVANDRRARMKFRNMKKVKKRAIQTTRKEKRREKRQEKKLHRAQYHSQKKPIPGQFVRSPGLVTKHICQLEPLKYNQDNVRAINDQERKRVEQLKAKKRKNQLLRDNEHEDRLIHQMEKKLKLNKRKSKTTPKSFTVDGLDYLLDFCNDENRQSAVEKQILEDASDNFEEDLAMVIKNKGERFEISSEDDDDSCSSEIGEEDEKVPNASPNAPGEGPSPEDDDIWEDIYGRKRDRSGQVVLTNTRYIPPAARQYQEVSLQEKVKIQRLEKQLKGLINRLAENNLQTVANGIEQLYMSNSRNNMNQLLFKLMTESIVSPVTTPDRLVAEHMMLVAILHANVGTEVGGHFILSLVKKFEEMRQDKGEITLSEGSQQVENKQMDNLLMMICHLYNFKLFAGILLYEILDKLVERFGEKEIELILGVLKTVGFALRKENPLSLKELIIKLQMKAAGSQGFRVSSRVQFMLDIIMAIKNNNMSKIPQYDPSHVEHLKKLLRTFLRKGSVITQFNISLDDLLKVDERGKWWIIGSAWGGNTESRVKDEVNSEQVIYNQRILDLAKKQRMNTDVRKNIFCILMTAEDFMDAFEKIQHLGLKDQQAREIIYILVDCCLQEKMFNPYYAVLAQKFCDFDRRNQMTLQYLIWDKLKALEGYSNIQLRNFAKFLSHLFLEKGLPLSVLKVVEFGQLDKPTMRLLRQIMLNLLMSDNTEKCLEAFQRISASSQLQIFREGLGLFISHFLLKNADVKALSEKQLQMLRERVGLVDRILQTRAMRTIL
ncbi:nucleolar MIF4G domain-containing protein 1 isoform X2 [Fopius arisanus]|uniref:Nucleolar MIF4G domain-containing protein 1 isoform X2 n=1 Tax=Fopius arisanus TaxID=64838 RepID=A0A9R1TPJ0_9HYME|nr:PREDICTED: nucleolar MIF4G domain-containing protein 1 isoform X2 [Fopius arisanus]